MKIIPMTHLTNGKYSRVKTPIFHALGDPRKCIHKLRPDSRVYSECIRCFCTSILHHAMRKELIFKAHIPGTNKFERDASGATFVRDSEEKVKMLVMEEKGWRKVGSGWVDEKMGDMERKPKQKAECQIVGCSCELKGLWSHALFIPKSPATLIFSNAPSYDARCDHGPTCGEIGRASCRERVF